MGKTPLELIKAGESPYKVQQINQALYSSDYQNLVSRYEKCQQQLKILEIAIDKAGMFLCFDLNGFPYLEKMDDCIPFENF